MEESPKFTLFEGTARGAIKLLLLTIFSGGIYAGYLILDGRQNIFAGACILLLSIYITGFALFYSGVAIDESVKYRKIIGKPSYYLSVFKELGILYIMAFSYAYGSFNFLKGKRGVVGYLVIICSIGLIFRLLLKLYRQLIEHRAVASRK